MTGLITTAVENLYISPFRLYSLFQGFSGSSGHRFETQVAILRDSVGLDKQLTGTEKDIGVKSR